MTIKGLKHMQIDDDEEEEEEKNDPDAEDEEEDEDEDARYDHIVNLLDLIEKDAILTPAQVLSILAQNPILPLRIVNDYIRNAFQLLQDNIKDIEQNIDHDVLKLQEISIMKQAEHQVKLSKKKNSLGTMGYDDYEEDEEDDDIEEEERKKKDNELWIELKQKQIETSQNHEQFFKELELSPDGFGTVATYFRKSNIIF